MFPNIEEFFKNFGNLINTALIVSLGGLLGHILKATIGSKDAHIKLLEGQLKSSEMFAAKNVNEQFKALQEWYDRSVENLEQEKRKAIESKETELRLRIEEEISKRTEIVEQYSRQSRPSSDLFKDPLPEAISGAYRVVGHNPDSPEVSYFGEIKIREKGKILLANWSIGPQNQKFSGIGLALGNAVAFHFQEEGGFASAGVVLYRFIGSDVMRGSWTGFGAEDLGSEECRRIGAF